jgi:hypothetical protein
VLLLDSNRRMVGVVVDHQGVAVREYLDEAGPTIDVDVQRSLSPDATTIANSARSIESYAWALNTLMSRLWLQTLRSFREERVTPRMNASAMPAGCPGIGRHARTSLLERLVRRYSAFMAPKRAEARRTIAVES